MSLEPLEKLTAALARLPGVGRRSARRMAMQVAREANTLVPELTHALTEVGRKLTGCSRCGNLTDKEQDPCPLCTDPRRDPTMLCVVTDPGDISLIEDSGAFRGRYHALLGKLSPMRQEGIKNPRIQALVSRVEGEGVQEVVLALDTDVESDATASFLRELLSAKGVKVTRLAFGMPAGSGIAYSDPVTLSRALQGRQPL